jgi:Golgi SNAP receptor complex protein 2
VKTGIENFIKRKQKTNSVEIQKQQLLDGSISDSSSQYIDIEMAENSSLERSSRAISDYIASGKQSFEELLSQRERLKGVQRKVFDIINYLGLSNSIMKTVERREITDLRILYVGMIVITSLLVIIFYYKFVKS